MGFLVIWRGGVSISGRWEEVDRKLLSVLGGSA